MPERRQEIEARLHCATCGASPYTLYRRETRPGSGVYENVLEAATRDVPLTTSAPICPVCGGPLRRVAP
jgi:hypothetical protein